MVENLIRVDRGAFVVKKLRPLDGSEEPRMNTNEHQWRHLVVNNYELVDLMLFVRHILR